MKDKKQQVTTPVTKKHMKQKFKEVREVIFTPENEPKEKELEMFEVVKDVIASPEFKPTKKDLKKQIKSLQDQVFKLEDDVLFWKAQLEEFNRWIGDAKKTQ